VFRVSRPKFSPGRPRAICFDFGVAVLGPFVIVLEMMFPEIDGVASKLIENLNLKDLNPLVE
jgi:hypothetical protein